VLIALKHFALLLECSFLLIYLKETGTLPELWQWATMITAVNQFSANGILCESGEHFALLDF
jgi:hypothetical protein